MAVFVEIGRVWGSECPWGSSWAAQGPLCSPGSGGAGKRSRRAGHRLPVRAPRRLPDSHPAAAPQVFVLLFIFVKRQIMRFAMKSRRGPHVPVGQHAPKVGILHSLHHPCLKGQAGAAASEW